MIYLFKKSDDIYRLEVLFWPINIELHDPNFILEPVFYGDLVYKSKIIVEKPYFSDQFKNILLDITWISCNSLPV